MEEKMNDSTSPLPSSTNVAKEGPDANNSMKHQNNGVQVRVNYHRRKRASTALVTTRILKAGLCLAFTYAAVSQALFLKKWATQNPRTYSNNDDDTPQEFHWQEGDAPDLPSRPKEVKFFEGMDLPIIGTEAPKLQQKEEKDEAKSPRKNSKADADQDEDDEDGSRSTRNLRKQLSKHIPADTKDSEGSPDKNPAISDKARDKTSHQLLSNLVANINKNPEANEQNDTSSPELLLIPGKDVEFLDKFSDSWLIDKKNFMALNIGSINFVEQACFQIMVRRHSRMTLDWTDFMVEHLSKFWSELKVLVDMDGRMFDHLISILHGYIEKHTIELKAAALQRKDMTEQELEDTKSPLHPTLAIIAYQTYESVFKERELLLSPFSLAATLVSLLQVGFGRIVIVGYKGDDRKHAQKAMELIAAQIPGCKLMDKAGVLMATAGNTTSFNEEDKNALLSLKVGHTDIAYVRIPSQEWVKTSAYKVNMPRGALYGIRQAIKGNLTMALHNASADDWLGTTHDRKYWKYFYLTEPDTILHTKRHLLPLIRDGLDEGTMYMPHRLQPLPHEYNLPPAANKEEGDGVNKKEGDGVNNTKKEEEEEVSRGNKHLSKRYRGRYIPGDIHPFSNITFLDPWNNQDDRCCDAGKLWPGRSEEFGEKQIPCGNWWWACGFADKEDVRNFTGDEIREKHKRLLSYPMMSLSSGSGIVFGPAEQGRRCFPSKEPCTLTTDNGTEPQAAANG